MIETIIVIVFELLLLLVIAGTLREWWKSKRHVELLPIVAYVLAMCSFAGPFREGVMHPWIVGFVWLAVGLVVRVIVRGRKKAG